MGNNYSNHTVNIPPTTYMKLASMFLLAFVRVFFFYKGKVLIQVRINWYNLFFFS